MVFNHVENAAQGLDLHADHVVVRGNVIVDSFIGMKAVAGGRTVCIAGNPFLRNSLMGHRTDARREAAGDALEHVDGGSIVAHDIVSEFGRGDAHWVC